MSIEEAIQAKGLLETQIRDLINQFECDTKLSIESINISKMLTFEKKPINTMIKITVELP